MQLVFANGVESPLFETEGALDNTLNTIEVDPTKEIRFVSMKVSSGAWYSGIRFYSQDQAGIVEALVDTEWSSDGEWTLMQKVPSDERIIGL